MRAIWSFWSKPFFEDRGASWASEFHHWLAWGLSLGAACNHYPETELITDEAGARILIDTLELPFGRVSTALDSLKDDDPGWWALGKLEAYRLQKEPFVHIDTDVFLWDPLSSVLETADVFAQNPEEITYGHSCYRPEDFERSLDASGYGWIPKEWRWYRQAANPFARAECCGIFGGQHIDFIHYYAVKAKRLLRDRSNRSAWKNFADKNGSMILVEQFLLTSCLEYHRNRPESPFHGVDIRYVFESAHEASRPEAAAQAGFTHLAAGAKRDQTIARNLEIAVERDLPEHYARCVDLVDALAH